MSRFCFVWRVLLAGAILWAGVAEQAVSQPWTAGNGMPGPGLGGRGRGWGAQMRRAQLAQKADPSSSSTAAAQATAAQAGCPGCCCMQGGCMMMGAGAATSQSLPMPSGANQTASATQGMNMGMGRGMGMGMGRGMGRGMGMGGPGPRQDMREAMPVIHDLLARHDKVKRKVEQIPQGIVAETTSVDLDVAAQIRKHTAQMKKRLEQGVPMRMWDPLFREIFRNANRIKMKVEDIPGGVRVTETSDDPQTQLLIRQHAQAVMKFVEQGMPAAMGAHELPAAYGRETGQ